VLTRRRSDGLTARTGIAVATSGDGGAAAAAVAAVAAPGVAGSEVADPGVCGGGGVSAAAAAAVSTARAASSVGAGRRAERGGGVGFEVGVAFGLERDFGGFSPAGSLGPSTWIRLIFECFWYAYRFDSRGLASRPSRSRGACVSCSACGRRG
jgi:hypothetical protein